MGLPACIVAIDHCVASVFDNALSYATSLLFGTRSIDIQQRDLPASKRESEETRLRARSYGLLLAGTSIDHLTHLRLHH